MELKCEHLTRKFRQHAAVNDVSFTLDTGVHALLGANDSGKTTLIRMLVGTLPPTRGKVTFDGISILKQYDTYCAYLGYMPQHFGYYPSYSVHDFLAYMGLLKRIPKKECEQRIEELLLQLNLMEHRRRKMRQLSGGMLRRVGIAQALLNTPKLLILDEPTAGLDSKERIIFRNLIASLANECTILLSTHIVSDIETIADDVLVMKAGRIIAQDSVDGLLEGMRNHVYEVTLSESEAQDLLMRRGIVKAHQTKGMVSLRFVADAPVHPLAKEAEPDLDDFYLYHFQEEGEGHDQADQK